MPTTAPVESLPLDKQLSCATGQLGWSILVNIVGVNLVYFYLPPDASGLPTLITTATFLVVLTANTPILASGRLLDTLTDPWIAGLRTIRRQHRLAHRVPGLVLRDAERLSDAVLRTAPRVGPFPPRATRSLDLDLDHLCDGVDSGGPGTSNRLCGRGGHRSGPTSGVPGEDRRVGRIGRAVGDEASTITDDPSVLP